MKALVTGATGFVGGALARRLRANGAEVTGIGRNTEVGTKLEAQGIRFVRADIADAEAIREVCRDQDIVFHSAALASPWGRPADFYASNVTGTENVIRGCMDQQVGRLVYVSTPSIYFEHKDRLNVKEDDPLPARPVTEYARTKLQAEQAIDRAHHDGLPVITIRPRAIFGPGDTTILPRLIDRLQSGRLPVIGDARNESDMTYIDNVVDALLLCAESPDSTLGKKYNITNGQPVRMWEMIKKLTAELGIPYPKRQVPYWVVDGIAGGMEIAYSLIPGQPEPPLTRYSVAVICRSTTLDISAARRDLGYEPRVSIEEGFERFVKWWKDTHQ